jgi:SPP1 gp7 family putative phage head morphogenesis protein
VSVRFTKRSSRVRMLSHTSRTSHDAPRALRRARDVSPHSYRQLHAIADAQQPSMARKLTTLLSVTIDARVRQTLATYDRDAIMLVLRPLIDELVANVRAEVGRRATTIVSRASAHAAQQIERAFSDSRTFASVTTSLSFDKVNREALSIAQDGLTSWLNTLSAEQYALVQSLLVDATSGLIDVRDFARRLQDSIGLTPQGAQALSTFEQGMLADGVAPGVAASRASSYAERLRRQRAETIARTETLNAANAGQQALWNEAGRVGLVDRARAWKEWIVTPDDRLCVLCEQMEGARVRVDDEFSTPRGSLEHPPMHPRCRCAMGLSFDPLDREGGA